MDMNYKASHMGMLGILGIRCLSSVSNIKALCHEWRHGGGNLGEIRPGRGGFRVEMVAVTHE